MIELSTFSVAARCARTGMLGVTVATALPAVASLCAFIRPGAGAVATQAWVNPYIGIDGLTRLRSGETAQQALDALLAGDPARETRQVGMVDRDGGVAAFTGTACPDWAGHILGAGFAVQGNILVGAATLTAMAEAMVRHEALPLYERLMRALEAGQAAGGDRRGRQSAALSVYLAEEFPYLDIRVDDHREPVAELHRVLEVAKVQLLPLVDGLPTRRDPIGRLPAAVGEMLLKPPAERGR